MTPIYLFPETVRDTLAAEVAAVEGSEVRHVWEVGGADSGVPTHSMCEVSRVPLVSRSPGKRLLQPCLPSCK